MSRAPAITTCYSRNEILKGIVQTEARNSFADFGAYEIYANQERIQKRILESLRPQIGSQLFLVTGSVQIGNPDLWMTGLRRRPQV